MIITPYNFNYEDEDASVNDYYSVMQPVAKYDDDDYDVDLEQDEIELDEDEEE